MDDPRLTVHPLTGWKEFRIFAWSDSEEVFCHQSARIERTEKGFQICIYNHTDYDALLPCWKTGLPCPRRTSGPTCAAAMSDPVPMGGDGLDYSMRLRWFEDMDEDENRPYDMEEPNFSACPSPTIPICGKWCRLIDLPPAAVTAGAISAAGWAHFSVSYPVRPTVSRKCRRTRN